MKCPNHGNILTDLESPSMRREWIEISQFLSYSHSIPSPSMRREWIEMPHAIVSAIVALSPSMRREWIEIPWTYWNGNFEIVSLHAEGVD